ncbi:MAG: hypothetical protein M0P71_16840 [Melioribacteraceae bacterium]|jgi:hypothetical protein|nr:hypothetical protein [Melioribacteraceae bacterium]
MNESLKSEIDINSFAKNLAQGNDFQQSSFINKFALELKVFCNDKSLTGLQPCNIAEKLDSNGINLIKSLNEFIKLREECKPK